MGPGPTPVRAEVHTLGELDTAEHGRDGQRTVGLLFSVLAGPEQLLRKPQRGADEVRASGRRPVSWHLAARRIQAAACRRAAH